MFLCGLDSATSNWSQPETRGKQPPPRHGHVIVAVGPKIYIHGGMSGDKFHNDMYTLDASGSQLPPPSGCCFPQMAPNKFFSCLFEGNMMWEKVRTKGDVPVGVAAHSAVVMGKNIYIFGGMTADGATNSMYRFNTGIHIFCENSLNYRLDK